jgi:FKBP-type peptidyl-prolyl cis-trans isomerase FklB
MNRTISTPGALLLAGLVTLLGCSQAGAASQSFANDEERQGYSLGVVVAQETSMGLTGLDKEAFLAGFVDALHERELSLSSEEIGEAMLAYQTRRMQEMQEAAEIVANANREAGDAYRAKFAEEADVVALESGLLYKVLEPGEGEVPEPGSTVTLHYRASLVDGTELDSSYSRSEPIRFPIGRGLDGWNQALERMPAGSKWQVVLPPELAYGPSGAGPLIGPNATLIFEMELIAES